jgi:putative flippase GtrA
MNKEVVRTIKFTLFSISAGIIEALVFALLKEVFHLSYWACYLPALIASVVWNFTLNREFTFKSAVNIPKAMVLVFLFYAIFTPVSTILGNYLAETLHWNGYLVTALNMASNFILEYLWDRLIVFRKTIDTK